MKKISLTTLILTLGIASLLLLVGCEEQNLTKKHRFIGAENVQLKKQLKQSNVKIEQQKQKLEKCQEESATARGQGKCDEMIEFVFQTLGEENKELKSQIEQLTKELEELKKPPPQPQ